MNNEITFKVVEDRRFGACLETEEGKRIENLEAYEACLGGEVQVEESNQTLSATIVDEGRRGVHFLGLLFSSCRLRAISPHTFQLGTKIRLSFPGDINDVMRSIGEVALPV